MTTMTILIKSPLSFSSSTTKTVALNPNPTSFLQINPNRRLINNYNYYHYHRTNKPSSSFFISFSHSKRQTPVAVDPTTAEENKIIKEEEEFKYEWRTQVGSPFSIITPSKMGFFSDDKASSLLAFFACTTCVAFTSFVIAAVPAIHAMGRAAISFSKLADTAREELPSTMATIRLSSMEISDLTLELSDLSQEITKGVHGSAQVVQAAEAGIRQMGSRAHQQTMSMIEERANLPDLSLQPVVVGAAKKTSHAVGQATKTFMNMISRGDGSPDDENADAIERLEI